MSENTPSEAEKDLLPMDEVTTPTMEAEIMPSAIGEQITAPILGDNIPPTIGDENIVQEVESLIRPYNPSTQRRAIRERLQSLEIINERFARQFRIGLFNIIHRNSDITVGAIKIESYKDFSNQLPPMTNLNLVHLKPLRGTALFTFEKTLVYVAVDSLFGGDGRFPVTREEREFTPTEQRIINKMMSLALDAYRDAWSSIAKITTEYIRSESQVKFTNITSSPNDIVITTPFLIEIGNMVGEFCICLPFSMIEPMREQLINPPVENNKQEENSWFGGLVNQVKYSELELVANFVDHPMRLSNILQLNKEDVIPIEKPDSIFVHVDGVPVLSGKYGTLNGQYALQIEHLINPVLHHLEEEGRS